MNARHPPLKETHPVFRSFYGRYLPEVPQAAKAGCCQATHNSPLPSSSQLRMRALRRCENQNPYAEAGQRRRLK